MRCTNRFPIEMASYLKCNYLQYTFNLKMHYVKKVRKNHVWGANSLFGTAMLIKLLNPV
jgi:hypothetical protein